MLKNVGRAASRAGRAVVEAFSPSNMGFARRPTVTPRIGTVADPARRNYKTLAGLGLATAAVVGVAKGIGSSAREAAMDIAFDDPNADAAFLGQNVSARFLAGQAIGGSLGSALKMSAPSDQFMINPVAPSLGSSIATGGIGAGLGALGGYALKAKRGALVGGLIGGIAGATAIPGIYTAGHIRRNENFYRRSPYNTSTQMAEQLNASGDIVLGMHNLRGGM